ncbi:MAG TPA: TonB family protein [Terriglobales bacterium]|jgi:TonB family protein|nr:TonB family protein [Terriglobales bacterium]
MSETWKQWEGQTVGEFPLLAYAGGSRHSAVFITRRKTVAQERLAIKVIRADASGAESQLSRWKKSAELNHPNLVRIFESGRSEIEGTPLLYVLMEINEEDLSQILPERALTPDEVRQLLPPVLDALEYIHGQGMVHGRLRPSNILATGDQVKISADTLRVSGERVPSPDVWSAYDPPEGSSERLTSAADVWSLAVTLVQALTQQRPLFHPSEPASPSLPENTPEPFREIARRCLQVDPQRRWTIAEIKAALQPKTSKPAAKAAPNTPIRAVRANSDLESKQRPPLWGWLLGLLAAAVVIGLIVAAGNHRGSSSASSSSEPQPQETSQANKAQPKQAPAPSEPKPNAAVGSKKASGHSNSKSPQSAIANGAVLQQVLPQVSQSARRTIEGKIRVVVRVDVDSSGNVTEAKLISPGPSKYFSRLAQEAARQWKFTPPQAQGAPVASQWTLRFGFRRTGTDVAPTETAP